MAFQAVPDGVEVVFNALQNNVPVVNVYNVRDTGIHDTARLTEIGNTFYDWWADNFKVSLSNSYVLQTIKVTSMELSTGPQVILNFTTANQGDVTGAQVAGNGAMVISWRTASIGRSYRGRTYVGGLAENALEDAQHFTSANLAAMAGYASNLIDALEAIGATLAVLSRVANGIQRITGVLTDIISIVLDNKVDSQRRRTAN